MVSRSQRVGLTLLAIVGSGCLIDRSSVASGRDVGMPGPADAFALDAPGLDAPGPDAPLPVDLDARRSEDDAFVVEGTDAWSPRVDDAWSPPAIDARPMCAPSGEICNARDDNCDGRVDEEGCGGSFGALSVSCAAFLHGGHVYQVCKARGFGVPWELALMACRNFAPYDLVQIDDNAENAAISSHVLDARAWIGLNDRIAEGSFVWANGTPLGPYDSWAGGEPRGGGMGNTENCATIAAGSPIWRDESCGVLDVSVGTDVGSFVCEAVVSP